MEMALSFFKLFFLEVNILLHSLAPMSKAILLLRSGYLQNVLFKVQLQHLQVLKNDDLAYYFWSSGTKRNH